MLAWFLTKVAVAGSALYLLSLAAVTRSQGQLTADMQGYANSIGASSGADNTVGHGYNAGALRLYTAAAATANAAEAGTKLVDQPLPSPCFGSTSAAVPSVLTANAITPNTILATGTAASGRMVANGDDGLSSTTERRLQFTVGAAGGGADMTLNTLSLVSGGTFSTTSLTISSGN